MESISELESLSLTSTLLEELGERASTGEPSALERMAALLSHRIIRVISVIEPLPEFWVREDLVCLVNGGHLGFRTSLVRVCLDSCFTAGMGLVG